MESKEARIAKLKEEITKIENEVEDNFMLYKIDPDCGGGIADTVTEMAISKTKEPLIKYCEEKFSYSPPFGYKRPEGDKEFCQTWYRIELTKIQIL